MFFHVGNGLRIFLFRKHVLPALTTSLGWSGYWGCRQPLVATAFWERDHNQPFTTAVGVIWRSPLFFLNWSLRSIMGDTKRSLLGCRQSKVLDPNVKWAKEELCYCSIFRVWLHWWLVWTSLGLHSLDCLPTGALSHKEKALRFSAKAHMVGWRHGPKGTWVATSREHELVRQHLICRPRVAALDERTLA